MATLYLTEQQTLVHKDGDTLVVDIPADNEKKQPKRKIRVPLLKIERVVVQGNSTITSPALAAMLENHIEITFLTSHGRFQGHLAPAFSKNGQLRLAQTAAYHHPNRHHHLAATFITGKLTNMRTMLLRANRKREQPAIAQATETIKLILGLGQSLVGRLLLYDALSMSLEEVKLRKNPKCAICGEHPTIDHLIDYEEFCGVPGHDHEEEAATDWDILPTELEARMKQGNHFKLIDVREPHEWEISHIEGARLIPLGELAAHMSELDSAEEIVLQCKSGARSMRALELLYTAGFRKLKNLRGGINAWAREVDPSLPMY